MTQPGPLLLPEGARLLHAGFYKTGTTSLQESLAEARPALRGLGVVYPGRRERHHARAAMAVVGTKPRIGDTAPDVRAWERLVRQVEAAGERRVLVSSEWFCQADDATVRRIVEGLGGDRVHVVMTLRPLTKILPSQWQQYVQNGVRTSYDGWLDGMLRKPPYNAPTPTFWRRHSHADIIERWARVVGPERTTVIVVDDSDHDLLLRQFEQMLGLPVQTLAQQERTNRSLDWPGAELVRHLNKQYHDRQWPETLYKRVVRMAVSEPLTHERAGARITTPAWALDRAAEIGRDTADRLANSGVRVLGDLEVLSYRPDPRPAGAPKQVDVPPGLAALAVAQAIEAARQYGHEEGYRDAQREYQALLRSPRRMLKAVRRRVVALRPGRRPARSRDTTRTEHAAAAERE